MYEMNTSLESEVFSTQALRTGRIYYKRLMDVRYMIDAQSRVDYEWAELGAKVGAAVMQMMMDGRQYLITKGRIEKPDKDFNIMMAVYADILIANYEEAEIDEATMLCNIPEDHAVWRLPSGKKFCRELSFWRRVE